MKKRLIVLLAFTLALSMLLELTAFAKDSCSLNATHDIKDGKVIVTGEICNIESEPGIVLVDYNVFYDKETLNLTSYDVKMPSAWEQYVSTEEAEDLSVSEDGVFRWRVLISNEVAIREDGEFIVTLEFTVKSSAQSTDISFIPETVLDYNFGSVASEEKRVVIDLSSVGSSGNHSGDISVDISYDNNPSDKNESSNDAVSSGNLPKDENSDNLHRGTQSNNGAVYWIFGIVTVIAVAVVIIVMVKRKKG